MAEPDGVVIAASTRRLTGGLFEYEDLGAIEAKGLPSRCSAWRVLRRERGREPLRGAARLGRRPDAARRPRGGDRAAAPALAAVEGGRRRPGGAPLGRAGHRQVPDHARPPGAPRRRAAHPSPATSARRTTGPASSIPSSRSSSAPPASSGTTPLMPSSTSSRRCSRPRARKWRETPPSWPRCCRSRAAAATRRGRISARRSARRRPSRRLLAQLGGLAARQSGADDLRGRALDRPDLARAARAHRRPGAKPARAAGRHRSGPSSRRPGSASPHVTMHPLNRLNRREGPRR